MNSPDSQKPQPRKVKGTAIFHADDSVEFTPQGEGTAVQRNVKKRGESRFYETEGEKQSSYVAHLKVNRNATDPAAEMFEQLDFLTKPLQRQESKLPRNKALLDLPGVRVWHRRQENKVIVMMEITPTATGELSSQLLKLTQDVNKCFAINRTSLLPPKK